MQQEVDACIARKRALERRQKAHSESLLFQIFLAAQEKNRCFCLVCDSVTVRIGERNTSSLSLQISPCVSQEEWETEMFLGSGRHSPPL